jgi:hypothetical protein
MVSRRIKSTLPLPLINEHVSHFKQGRDGLEGTLGVGGVEDGLHEEQVHPLPLINVPVSSPQTGS